MSDPIAMPEYARAVSTTSLDRRQSSLDSSLDPNTIEDNVTSQAEGLLCQEDNETGGGGFDATFHEVCSVRGVSSDETSSRKRAEKNACPPYEPLTKSLTLSKWGFEILALFVSTSAFTAIVVTLKMYDGKPPPKSAYLNINTLVALFSTILRATVAYVVAKVISQSKWLWMKNGHPLRDLEEFHNASTGPWGSFKFIFLTWKPYKHLSCSPNGSHQFHRALSLVSAIVIILSVAIGPFSQQAATNNICVEPILHGYSAWVKFSRGPRTNMKDADAVAAALNGLMYGASDSSAATSSLFLCGSSNCTFGGGYPAITHASIGICSACTNVNSSLKELGQGIGITRYQFAESTNFSISESERLLDMRVTLVSPQESHWGQVSGANITVSTIAMDKTASPKPGLVAANCTIYPCVRRYNANVTNGIFNESVLSQTPMELEPDDDPLSNPGFIAMIDPCYLGSDGYDRSNMSGAPRTKTWRTQHGNFQAPPRCVGNLSSSFYSALYAFLSETVAGTCGYEPDGQDCDKSKWWTSSFIRDGTFERISGAFDGMATAITNHQRANSGDTVYGRQYETYICLKVDWLWLLYPGVLLVLTMLILMRAIEQSFRHRGRQPVWKSQILPLLFYDVRTQQRQDSFDTVPLLQIDQMERLADKTVARFESYAGTIGFIVEKNNSKS